MDGRLLFGVGTLLALLWMGLGGATLVLRRGWAKRRKMRARQRQQAAAISLERQDAEIARRARKATVRAFQEILGLFGGRVRFRKRLPVVMILGHMLRILDALYDEIEQMYVETEQHQPQGHMMREAIRRIKALRKAVQAHRGGRRGPGHAQYN